MLIRKSHTAAVIFVVALGTTVLVGWFTGLKKLHTPLLHFGRMSPLAAIAFLLAGLSIWLWCSAKDKRRIRAARICGAAVVLIGLQGVAKHLIPPFVGDLLAMMIAPRYQIALTTAFSFIFIGCALCMIDSQARWGENRSDWLAFIAAVFPVTVVIGYIYGVRLFTPPQAVHFSHARMALHTAVGLLALCFAILTARPERGWVARFLSSQPEGVVARKLLPTGVVALLGLGWLTGRGYHIKFYGHDDGAAIFVALSALTFGLLIRHGMNALAALESSRQTTEVSLRRSEEHLRMALEAARVGTWEWEIGTNRMRWSEAIEDMFGIPAGTFDGRGESFVEIIHPEDRDLVQSRAFQAVQNGNESYHVEYRIVRPDGSIRWVASRGEVFRDENGRPARMAGTSIDITERRRMERELIEASNREQRRLGQDLHDDLGQWLTGIHLETRALAMKLKPKSESDAAHAERIVTCVREALERTRMLARGMTPAVIESGGLASALQELAASTERMFRTTCHCLCSEEVTVHNAEAALQLFRIAQEAISNAIRHGNATEITLGLEPQEGGRARLFIRDNGSGIPQPLPQSSGLGLHIMRYRAGLLGAILEIRPAPKGGTEVICSFSSRL